VVVRAALGVSAILISALAVVSCTAAPADPQAVYVAALQQERAAKDEAFLRQVDQPVPAGRQQVFLPLRYFPADPAYAVTASFSPATARTAVQMPTSTGKLRDMEQVGALEFTLKGRALSLAPSDRLFVPFTDLTSGTETYPAGRYLELERTVTGVYVVDFNRAFHPYCYYNDTYDCPYPPPTNRLPIPVRAGEKLAQSNVPSAGRN
jgi:uncharacterized protein (DUF1684 family)